MITDPPPRDGAAASARLTLRLMQMAAGEAEFLTTIGFTSSEAVAIAARALANAAGMSVPFPRPGPPTETRKDAPCS